MDNARKPYPSDVTDTEWEFQEPFFNIMRDDAPQRKYTKRELFNGMRFVAKTGCQWRALPNDFPPWPAIYQPGSHVVHRFVPIEAGTKEDRSGGQKVHPTWLRKRKL